MSTISTSLTSLNGPVRVSSTPLETPPSGRAPGRTWTVRLTGHADRTATVSCSTGACTMPPRSRDVAALRRFAALHAASHAKAARVRDGAACQCWAQRCSAHEGTRTLCYGGTVLVLRHDPAVGRVWQLSEVCSACAKVMTHTRVVGLPAPTAQRGGTAPQQRSEPAGDSSPVAAAPAAVAVGFSSPTPAGVDDTARRTPGQTRRAQRRTVPARARRR